MLKNKDAFWEYFKSGNNALLTLSDLKSVSIDKTTNKEYHINKQQTNKNNYEKYDQGRAHQLKAKDKSDSDQRVFVQMPSDLEILMGTIVEKNQIDDEAKQEEFFTINNKTDIMETD